MATFRDKELLLIKPDWIKAPKFTYSHKVNAVRFYGTEHIESLELETTVKKSFVYNFFTRQAAQEFIDFFDARMGRYESFWCPSWRNDFHITDEFTAGTRTLTIEDVDYNNTWRQFPVTGRFIYMEWPDGTYEINTILSGSGTTLTLAGDLANSATVDEAAELLVCFLYLVRFDIDTLEIEYNSTEIINIDAIMVTDGVTAYFDGMTATTTTSTTSMTTSTRSASSYPICSGPRAWTASSRCWAWTPC